MTIIGAQQTMRGVVTRRSMSSNLTLADNLKSKKLDRVCISVCYQGFQLYTNANLFTNPNDRLAALQIFY